MMNKMSASARELGRDVGVGDDDLDRRGDHEEELVLAKHPADDAVPAAAFRDRAASDALADPAHDQHDRDEAGGDQRAERQPVDDWRAASRRRLDFARGGGERSASSWPRLWRRRRQGSSRGLAPAARGFFLRKCEEGGLGARQAAARRAGASCRAADRAGRPCSASIRRGMDIGFAAHRGGVAERFGDRLDHRLEADARFSSAFASNCSKAMTLAPQVRKCLAVKSPPVASRI